MTKTQWLRYTTIFRVTNFAVALLASFVLTHPSSPAAALPCDGMEGFSIEKEEESGARCISPLPGSYRYLLPDAIRTPFQSPYTQSLVPEAEELAAIRRDAEDGDPEAQLYLGHFYVNGDGVDRDVAAGAAWYRRAAEGGNARAQNYLGFLYECGVGVERDYAEAFHWYMKAVEQGDPAAHLGIAGFHFAFRKRYMPTHFGQYVHWRMKAVYLTGDPGPQRPSLEECVWNRYHSGARFHQNDIVIAEILRERAIAGDHEATLNLAKIVLHAQGVSRAQKLGSDLVYGAAGQGSETAAYILGAVGMTNDLVDTALTRRDESAFLAAAARPKRDTYFVYTWHNAVKRHKSGMRELADAGYAPARYKVAQQIYSRAVSHLYSWRTDHPREALAPYAEDLREGFEMFERAAMAGHRHAMIMAAFMKMFGLGTEQDDAAGQALLEEAVATGDVFAIGNHLPVFYHFCDLAPENTLKLKASLEERRRAGDAFATLWLGYLVQALDPESGEPVDLFLEALKNGAYPAVFALREIEVGMKYGRRKQAAAKLTARLPEMRDLRRAAAMDGYGPAILYILEDFAWGCQAPDREEGMFWLDRYFTRGEWYDTNCSIIFTAKEIDEVYRSVHGGNFPYSLNSGWMYFSRHGDRW